MDSPTPRMDWQACDLPTAFKEFRAHTEFMFGGPLKKKDEEEKCNYLMLWVGEKGRQIYSTWQMTDAEKKTLSMYYDHFETYCKPKSNQIYARYRLKSRVQADGELFEQFVTDLKVLIKDCGYPADIHDELIRDHIVFGVRSPQIREKLINEGTTLTLDKCMDIARTHEMSRVQMKEMNPEAVHAIGHRQETGARKKYQPDKQSTTRTNQYVDSKCGNCGFKQHSKMEQCPAKGETCNYCHKLNHFATVCRKKMDFRKSPGKHVNRYRQNVHEVCSRPDLDPNFDPDFSENDFYVDSINYDPSQSQAFATLKIGPRSADINMKIDSGSQVNIIPMKLFKSLNILGPLSPAKKQLTAYDGKQLQVIGCITLACSYQQARVNHEFFIVETSSTPIVGLETSLALDLIRLIYAVDTDQHSPIDKSSVMTQYSDIFTGIGLFPDKCSIHLKPDAVPIVNPPRRIPIALRDPLKAELQRMEQAAVIEKVTTPTDWVNSLVIVQKSDGKMRLCLDPKSLNDAIRRPHYPMRTLEDILPELSSAKYFSKLDARSGYWAIQLTEESSYLTTFSTCYGRYRFLRLPFGIKSSQDEFQRQIDKSFEGLTGCAAIVDDILIWGQDREEHDRNLEQCLKRCRQNGIKLNPDKTEVGLTEVQYFGHVLSADGLKPDPAKVAAIRDMKPPENRSELETVLGMITYLSRFAPNLAELTSPLRKLLAKDVEFLWDQPQEVAFDKIKDVITQHPGPVLAYFKPDQEVTLQVDASSHGLGATLLQNNRPIAYASKSLTPSEQNFAQIEKELFAVVFGCKRFHQFVYGRHITVQSDHKPLAAIMKKPLHTAPARLMRMLLQLQKYDIDLTHVPGKDIPLADTLSRKSLPDTYPELSDGMDVQVNSLIMNMPISDQKMETIRQATSTDTQLKLLKHTILDGWPDKRQDCPQMIVDYWNYRDELTFIDGIILKGLRVLIPTECRPLILDKVHIGHMGVEKCLNRAREVVFWPNMTKDITELVLKCPICLEHRNSTCKEPLQSSEIPDRAWQVIATDLFIWNQTNYVIVVDYYSRYFEVGRLRDTKATTVINKIKSFLSRHGIVQKCISDNGPQYASEEFKRFAKEWDFEHVCSSPLYPQSNGLAEKTVQTVKRLFTKAQSDGNDPYLALLEYRNTPLQCRKSPAQLLMGRQLRSVLPITSEHLVPRVPNTKSVREQMSNSRKQQKIYYDRSSASLKPLEIGEPVRIQTRNGLWKRALVCEKVNNRSYVVETDDGGTYRRNRRHLLKTNETLTIKPQASLASRYVALDHTSVPSDQPNMPDIPLIPAGNTATHVSPPSPQVTPDKHSGVEQPSSPRATCTRNPGSPYKTRSGRIVKQTKLLNM